MPARAGSQSHAPAKKYGPQRLFRHSGTGVPTFHEIGSKIDTVVSSTSVSGDGSPSPDSEREQRVVAVACILLIGRQWFGQTRINSTRDLTSLEGFRIKIGRAHV